MTPDKKKHLLHDILTVIMLLAVLLTIVRLWPLLLLLLIGLIAYALWVLFHVARQPVKTEPVPLLMLPAPVAELVHNGFAAERSWPASTTAAPR